MINWMPHCRSQPELGDKSGTLIYTYQGQEVGKVPVTITDKYYNKIHGIEEKKTAKAEKKETKERRRTSNSSCSFTGHFRDCDSFRICIDSSVSL